MKNLIYSAIGLIIVLVILVVAIQVASTGLSIEPNRGPFSALDQR